MQSKLLTITHEGYKAAALASAEAPEPLTRLVAARGEAAPCQVVLATGGRACRVNVGPDASLGGKISTPRYRVAVEAPFAVEMYPVAMLEDEEGVRRGEVLCSDRALEADGSAPAVVWLDILVPADARPGKYEVTVRVYAAVGAMAESLAGAETLLLEVKPTQIPQPEQYTLYVDLWQQTSNLARSYGVELWSPAHFAVLRPMLQSLQELGQKSVTALVGDCPWNGWGCYLFGGTPAQLYEYSMVRIARSAGGGYRYDFAPLEQYIALCAEYGIDGDITLYGLLGIWKMPFWPSATVQDYPEKVMIRYLDEASGAYRYMETRDEVLAYVHALAEWFAARGLAHKVRLGADEPHDIDAFRAHVQLLKAEWPGVKLKIAMDKTEVIQEFAGDIEDVVSSFPCTCNELEFLHRHKAENPGKRFLWYTCNIPDRPNIVLHSPLLQGRALGALAYRFGLQGILRWAYTAWPNDPLHSIRYNDLALPAGDVNLIYPAKNGGVQKSVRWKALQRGIQDYELLCRVAQQDKPLAERALALVLKNKSPESYMANDKQTTPGIVSESYTDYAALRELLLDALAGQDAKENLIP